MACINAQSASVNGESKYFSEGIIYSRTSFPGHPLNDTIKALKFYNGDFNKQSRVIQALKEYQQSIKQEDEQSIKDAFFISAMMVLPQYSQMYFTRAGSLVKTYALGYSQEVVVNNQEHSGKLVLVDRDKNNQGTINFSTNDTLEVWQKYQVGIAQYSKQETTEIANVAGYPCKKIIYTFNGNSGGIPVTNYIVNMQPVRLTVWYTDQLPNTINLIHPLYFELDKAVLKFEVEYDKNRKNKMLVEITGLEPRKINEDDLRLMEIAPSIDHKKNDQQSTIMIMQIMMNAIGQLTKQ